ncbi:NucA/NucB deoxyribonuclease domain-containing protein [Streptomyces flavofungini]|uniref:NucA/NucB deoxyribonuclease domain-containing protein n=1 Tax=Streptomyces flavofungini TaxID=68200 RepID=UPI003F541E08
MRHCVAGQTRHQPVPDSADEQGKRKANQKKACPPSLPRPPGKSCGEYPFASTWQGARARIEL